MYCDCSGCEYKNGGSTALPFKTSAAVVGLINAPALTKNAKRPLLKMLFKGAMAEFRPMLCPKKLPDNGVSASFFTAMLGLDFS